ncbi:MAG: hypothetical protein ABMB14_17895 [Myxococcota bacterium]
MIASWLAATAWAGIALETPPIRGGETVVVVQDDAGDARSGETVRVIHRPGLAGEKELAIGITDGRGRVRWTPEVDGVARIRAGEATTVVRVEPDEAPIASVVVLALVSAAAVGALGYGLVGPGGTRR